MRVFIPASGARTTFMCTAALTIALGNAVSLAQPSSGSRSGTGLTLRGETYPRAGWFADMPPGAHQAEGIATIVDAVTIQVDHFTYDGTAPAVYFYLGASDTHEAFVDGLRIEPRLDRAYDDESLTLTLPEGETLDGYHAISVWCDAFDVSFTSGPFLPPPPLVGDLNCDGLLDLRDINPFTLRLSNPEAYESAFPGCPDDNGDINYDGVVDFRDINPFVALLAGGALRTLELGFAGLENLGDDFVYEGWFIVDGMPVSTGRFSINDMGQLEPDAFTVFEADAMDATLFVLTIEPAEGDDPAPSATHVLAGGWNGEEAALTVGHPAALGDDFSTATGAYILQTPTTASIPDDYDQGIWYVDPMTGTPGLVLPTLPAGWAYEGWVVGGGGPISTGPFVDPALADFDGAGPYAGPDGFPPFPGQDFIDPAMSLVGGLAVISVEPDPDNSPAPFAIKPLVDMLVEDVGPGVLQGMTNNSGANPTGTATLDLP